MFFQLVEYKKRASLTILGFVVSPGSSILTEDHEFVQEEIFFLFSFLSSLHLRFSRRIILFSRPTAPTVFAELMVDNKRYARHTGSRNIKYSRAFTMGSDGKGRLKRSPIVGPLWSPVGKKKKKKKIKRARANELTKKRSTCGVERGRRTGVFPLRSTNL